MKQLNEKHLRNLKLYKITDDQMKRAYAASYILGLQAYNRPFTRSYGPYRKVNIKAMSDLIVRYKNLDNTKNRRANVLKWIKIARALKRPELITAAFVYSGRSTRDFVHHLKRSLRIVPANSQELQVPSKKYYTMKDNLMKRYRLNQISTPSQVPEHDKKEFIGLEVECFIPEEHSDTTYLQRKVNEFKVKNLSVKTDGSIEPDDDYIGREFTILLEKADYKRQLKNFTDFLRSIGAQVNRTCGLHVHLDMRLKKTATVSTIAKRLGNSLDILKQVVPSSRRNNSYCQLGVSTRNGSRYYAINMTSMRKYKTIEVRLHSATTDYKKIDAWIELLHTIAETKNTTKIADFKEFSKKMKLSDELTNFYDSRIKAFNRSTESNESDDDLAV